MLFLPFWKCWFCFRSLSLHSVWELFKLGYFLEQEIDSTIERVMEVGWPAQENCTCEKHQTQCLVGVLCLAVVYVTPVAV